MVARCLLVVTLGVIIADILFFQKFYIHERWQNAQVGEMVGWTVELSEKIMKMDSETEALNNQLSELFWK